MVKYATFEALYGSPKQANKAIELALAGNGIEAIRKATGLNHSKVERAGMGWLYFCSGQSPIEATAANVARLRVEGAGAPLVAPATGEAHCSWGRIAVAMGISESTARRLYSEATGTDHKGTRNGRGGRWLGGKQELYVDNLKAFGTAAPVGTTLAEREAMAQQKVLLAKGMDELRAMVAEATGKAPDAKRTKAQLIKVLQG